jgi:hypothetical protein
VSYSAGFINYFFRGRLQITPPALGAYAVADHSEGRGFTTIKAKVKNVTPGEAMRGGTVVAVVKFRLNECYRTNEEFILTSAEQALTLGSGEEEELTFALTEPLPFAATDVYLQVVHQGNLGDEPRSIAMGTADISAIRSWISTRMAAISRRPGKIADLPALPEGRFSRIALLVGSVFNARVRVAGSYDYRYSGRPRRQPVERIVPRAALAGENGDPRALSPAEALPR